MGSEPYMDWQSTCSKKYRDWILELEKEWEKTLEKDGISSDDFYDYVKWYAEKKGVEF